MTASCFQSFKRFRCPHVGRFWTTLACFLCYVRLCHVSSWKWLDLFRCPDSYNKQNGHMTKVLQLTER